MSKKQNKIETISINGQEYVLASEVKNCEPAVNTDGLKYAIVRSRYQGVMSGFVKRIDGQTVVLLKARQLWRYDSKFVLVDMAEFGVRNEEDCKFSYEMSQEMIMTEACGIIYCTESAMNSIRNVKAQDHG